MEYLPGTLDPNDLNMRDTTLIATQILGALAHIHADQIVHGDVKPSNILIRHGPPLAAKLGDFGVARHLQQDNTPALVGTPLYMAPELRANLAASSSMADMFSFGLVLLQCLSSSDLSSDTASQYDLSSPSQHCEWMGEVIIPLVEETPEAWRLLLRGTLRRDPAKRWSALQCLEWLSHSDQPNQPSQSSHPPISGQGAEADKEQRNASRKRPASLLLSERVPVGVVSPTGVMGSTDPTLSEGPSSLQCDIHTGSQTPGASFSEPRPPSEAPTPLPDVEQYSVGPGDEQHPLHVGGLDLRRDWFQ
jgi:serine/threonine protein kinase